MKCIRVGIIGLGIVSKNHAEAFKSFSEVEFTAAADIDIKKCELFESEYKIHSYTDYKEMIKTEKLDAAVIALPHGLHKEAAVFCAEHGVNILLEKPMANTSLECEAIISAAKEYQIKLMIGHVQRYIAENIKAKELINSGKYGKLVCVTDVRNVNYFTDVRPRWFFDKKLAGGGILMNYGVHSLDKLIWIADSEIARVNGAASQFIPNILVDGNAQLFVELKSGVTAVLTYCGYNIPSVNETIFYLTDGVIKLRTGNSVSASSGGEFENIEVSDTATYFVHMWRDFIDLLNGNSENTPDGFYGMNIIKAVEKIINRR